MSRACSKAVGERVLDEHTESLLAEGRSHIIVRSHDLCEDELCEPCVSGWEALSELGTRVKGYRRVFGTARSVRALL